MHDFTTLFSKWSSVDDDENDVNDDTKWNQMNCAFLFSIQHSTSFRARTSYIHPTYNSMDLYYFNFSNVEINIS